MISVSKNAVFTILISKNRFSTIIILQTSISETKKTIPRTIGMNSWGDSVNATWWFSVNATWWTSLLMDPFMNTLI